MNNPMAKKDALGIMLDGRDLRIAHLGWKNGKIAVFGVEQTTLQRRVGGASDRAFDTEGETSSPFGVSPDSLVSEGFGEEQAGDVSGILVNLLSKYPLKNALVAVNIPDNQVSFHQFKDDFGLKGKALRHRVREAISMPAGEVAGNEMLDVFKSADGGLTAVASGGGIPLVETLLDVRTFLPGGALNLSLVEANEVALVNLARATMDLVPNEITFLIYIGREFSSIVVLNGDHPRAFVQTIHEGYLSERVCNTLFARILLEQEESDLSEIHHIVLAGEIGTTRAVEFFKKQFPEVDVKPMAVDGLDTTSLESKDIGFLPKFAIPIAMAWETLDRRNPRFLRLNLTPESIRSTQQFFTIAWHGFAVLGLIFVLMVGLSYGTLARLGKINTLERSVQRKQEALVSLQADLSRVGLLKEQIDNYEANLRFLDSQIVDPGKWSRLFAELTRDFATISRIWMENVESVPQGFRIVGRAQYRKPIPRLAYLLPNADLKRVTRIVSEEGELTYEFELTAGIPPAEMPGESSPPKTTRTTAMSGGVPDGKWAMEQTGTTGSALSDTAQTQLKRQ